MMTVFGFVLLVAGLWVLMMRAYLAIHKFVTHIPAKPKPQPVAGEPEPIPTFVFETRAVAIPWLPPTTKPIDVPFEEWKSFLHV